MIVNNCVEAVPVFAGDLEAQKETYIDQDDVGEGESKAKYIDVSGFHNTKVHKASFNICAKGDILKIYRLEEERAYLKEDVNKNE